MVPHIPANQHVNGSDRGREANFLRQALDRLQALESIINRSPAMTFLWPIKEGWPVEFVSKNVEQILGYSAEEFISGKISCQSIAHPDDLPEIHHRLDCCLKEGVKEFSQEFRVITKSGEERWMSDRTVVLFDQSGNPSHIQSIVIDVTKRKHAEKLRQHSENRFKELADLLPQVVFEVDVYGNITFANRIAFETFGYTRKDLERGINALDILTPEDRERGKNNIGRVLKGEQLGGVEYTAQRKDGTLFPVEIHSAPIVQDSRPVGLRGLIIDLTDRKNVEEALRYSEMKFRSLFDLCPQAIAVTSLDTGTLVDVNEEFCRLTQYSQDEILGRPTTELAFYSDEARNRFLCELKGCGEVHGLEMDFPAKDTSVLNTLMFAKLLHVAHEDFILTVFVNMTEKTKLQARLQRAQNMEAVGTLAGGVAHDLNNILLGLVSYPDLLLMDLPESSPLHKALVTIKRSGIKAAAIVHDLLTLSRREVAVMEVLNVNDIIQDYLESPEHAKIVSYHPGVNVETKIETDLPDIVGSSVHLSKTLMNLLSNAAEAMPEGGTISIVTEARSFDRPTAIHDHALKGDYVVLIISDEGIGISPEDQGKIFEPFYTKKVLGRSGTGLGMAVVWTTVQDHKGHIDVQSTVDRGSTFTLYFPVTKKKRKATSGPLSIDHYKGNGESVLVVDDRKEQREIASTLLKNLGYTVHTAARGEEAIEYVKTVKPDLLILDMIMDPGIDGLETFEKVLAIHPNQKAIMVSGFSETARVREALRLGVGAYIKKPYELRQLGQAVRAELDKRWDHRTVAG